ncbi:Uncharacterised protein [Mycobacteroides abscessus subsp. abscessus]|nr:Uncharacterised protein [Mycobacteroides abscessus subsp. abscessus]
MEGRGLVALPDGKHIAPEQRKLDAASSLI